jgi:hypothetical protein
MTLTLTQTLTAEQRENWLNANWGAFTREGSRKVAETIIAMLEEGINARLITRDYYDLMNIIEKRSGVDEVTDTSARESVLWVLEKLMDGFIPRLSPDHNEEEDE